jgi:hypothetical protein
MGKVLRPRGRAILPLLLSVLAGCSRPATLRSGAETSQPTVPFHDGEDTDSKLDSASDEIGTSDGGVPFHDGQSLPIGTLLTVRLTGAIKSQLSEDNATFDALVDEPVVVDGYTLVPRGASVAGRIESTHYSTMQHNRGYVRLTLQLVDIAGRQLPIRTSSLFARGSAVGLGRQPTDTVSLEQGRRLTFRLSEALALGGPPPDIRR